MKSSLNIYLEFRKYSLSTLRGLNFFLNTPANTHIFPFKKKFHVFLFLTIISFILYFNTLGHEYAYDDEQVLLKNEFVLRGIKGIPDIMTHDSHYSFYKMSRLKNILPGGRYRPLSQVTFAIEQQLVGVKHDSTSLQNIWDLNGNTKIDIEEDFDGNHILNEKDFYNRGLGLRHFINVLLYTLVVGLIFLFSARYLQYFSPDAVLVACLLFVVLPIHTEVVANIKSRDELLSLLFILLSFISAFRFNVSGNFFDLLFFTIFFFMGLLSKEFSILLPVLIPLLLFTQFKIKFDFSLKSLIIPFSLMLLSFIFPFLKMPSVLNAFILVILFFLLWRVRNSGSFLLLFSAMAIPVYIYLILRLNATAEAASNYHVFKANIISNPYLPATWEQTIATKIFILLKYICLTLFPFVLSCDYSYSSIPYRDFHSFDFWLSIFVYLILSVLFIVSILRRSFFSFPLLILLFFLVPVSNLFVDIGATMGERLFFHSTLGLCFILVWPMNFFSEELYQNKKWLRFLTALFVISVSLYYSYVTVNRNKDWKNNLSLFTKDVTKYPRNVNLCSGAASNLLDQAYLESDSVRRKLLLEKSIQYVDTGLQQAATFTPLFQTLALDYLFLRKYSEASSVCRAGLKVDSTDLILMGILKETSWAFLERGIFYYRSNNLDSAFKYFRKSLKSNSLNADAYYNLAYLYKEQQDTLHSLQLLDSAILIDRKEEFFKLRNKLAK
jgi:protein O-mannosyl-transferase